MICIVFTLDKLIITARPQ